MSRRLPPRPSLSSLRKQAKQLLRQFNAADSDARALVQQHHPDPASFATLRDAQAVLASDYGFSSWLELKRHVEARAEDRADSDERSQVVDEFLDLACLRYGGDAPRRIHQAGRLFEQHPDIARDNIWAAAAVADLAALERMASAEPQIVSRPGGPREWPPLLYLCYSRIPDAPPGRDSIAAARLLLDRGADPNSFFLWDNTYRFTALTGAIGEGEEGIVNQPPHPHARELAVMLLDAGADPNDGQALYNSMFSESNQWLELLLEYGLKPTDMVNWTSPNPMPILDYLLGQASKAGMVDRASILLEAGANPNSVDFYDRRSAYENASRSGTSELVDLLLAHGATPVELSPAAEFQGACMSDDEDAARSLLIAHPQLVNEDASLVQAAKRGQIETLQLLVELGADINRVGGDGSTALHQAAWSGQLASVRFLVEHGASFVRDRHHQATPLGWASYGGQQEVAAYLLQHADDVFDLVEHGRGAQLTDVLAKDPARARERDARGNTPLHYLGDGSVDTEAIVDLLVRHGAALDTKNDAGKTALDVATERGAERVVRVLSERSSS